MKYILLLLINLYKKFISPVLPPSCRFYPTCSHYAHEAISKHGALKGSWLATKRVAKCHPFHPGGFDPVPDPKKNPHNHKFEYDIVEKSEILNG